MSWFLMVIMASGIACGCVRTTMTTTESCNMAAILQIIGWQRYAALIYHVLLWYWTSMLWSFDTCQNKVSADQHPVTISRAQVYNSSRSRVFSKMTADQMLVFDWIVRLTCWKQGRIVWEPVNSSPGLKFIQIITFSCIQMIFCDYETQNRRSNNKQKTSPQSYKTQIKILPFSGLAKGHSTEIEPTLMFFSNFANWLFML